ncbi:MAG TPA: hypothetical protein VML19_30270 [Verrucomicrobiae bacterium]|nr:hypothetical protein [Verrucomicrobiae bacterium]
MVRAFSLFGLAALFLMISPTLRGHVIGGIGMFVDMLQAHSPWSYVIGGIGLFALFTISLNRGAAPR